MRGDPYKMEFIYKKLCMYSYMFKLESPSKYSPFDAIHLFRLSSHCPRQFLVHWFWCLLVLLPFCFTSSTSAKRLPLGTFFIWGNKKKSSGWDWVSREDGAQTMLFLVKNCWTLSLVWAGMLINHPSWNRQTRWRSISTSKKKNSLISQCQLVHWYRWVPRTVP